MLVDGATNTAGAGAIEVELDMEVVSAIAPGATQKIYIGPNRPGRQRHLQQDRHRQRRQGDEHQLGAVRGVLRDLGAAGAQQIFQQMRPRARRSTPPRATRARMTATTPASRWIRRRRPERCRRGRHESADGQGGTYTSESVWSNSIDTRAAPRARAVAAASAPTSQAELPDWPRHDQFVFQWQAPGARRVGGRRSQ